MRKSCIRCSKRWLRNFGSQCGYCTPGFIMSLFEGYYRNDLKTAAQLDEQLCGNLCRCTGYRPIRDAAAEAFAKRNGADAFDEQLKNSQTASERGALQLRGGKFPSTDFVAEILRRDGAVSRMRA